MNTKMIQRAFGLLSFLTALAVYLMTVQQTVPFWDCGEFSAASIWQQVPHPPGAPLFLMLGKLFHVMIPFGDPGWRVNLVSVFSSAITVWLLYLITVMVLKNLRQKPIETFSEAIAVYGSGFIAAAALTFSDTFWFNAVESEVYAASSLFVAVIVYLMMKWNEEADKPGHERYLLLIAYLMGLSTGVHLLALLAIFSIVYLVYFKKYSFNISSFVLTTIIAVVIFAVIYPVIVKWIPAMLAGHFPFKNDCQEYKVESPLVGLLVIGAVIGAAIGLWYGFRTKNHTMNLIASAFLLMILGYTTYTQILIRSNANSPMNENEPKNLTSLTSYLGREQYGEAPNWPRRYQATDEYYIRNYEKTDESGEYVYGEWVRPEREDVECKDGRFISVPKFRKTNVSGEINYLWKYQINHMYLRYFFWNYVGRLSDVQDADFAFSSKGNSDELNFESGYAAQFPIRFFALPLLFGLIGLFYHFWKDPKMAFVYLVMFLLMGVITAIYQNQQEPQPRERDYFYAGSFFVFCMWIGMAVYGIIESIDKEKFKSVTATLVLAVSILAIPINMAAGGWKIHNRHGNFLPFDYSYNILQSTEKDAILFTNGDNDTFPLWYLQDVAGVRRDVRIVNLSLGNTLWYIDQLKNREPWGAKKIPLSFSDDSLRVNESDPRALSYDFGEALNISIPVKPEILAKFTKDPAVINAGRTDFTFVGKEYTQREGKPIYLYRVQDKLVLNIMRQVKFERPIYFSVTVGPDAFCGLDNFFRYEGMAMRVCPISQKTAAGDAIEPTIMEKCLMNIDNSDNYQTGPSYGFKLRNLNNKDVYYDEVARRLMITYRTIYFSYAGWMLQNEKKPEKAIAAMDALDKYISTDMFPMNFELDYQVAQIYNDAGAKDKARTYAKKAIASSMKMIENPKLRSDLTIYELLGRYFGPYRRAAKLYEMTGDFKAAKDILTRFKFAVLQFAQTAENDPMYAQEVPRMRSNAADIQTNIEDLTIKEIELKQGKSAALAEAMKLYKEFSAKSDQESGFITQFLERRIQELGGVNMNVDSNRLQANPQ